MTICRTEARPSIIALEFTRVNVQTVIKSLQMKNTLFYCSFKSLLNPNVIKRFMYARHASLSVLVLLKKYLVHDHSIRGVT